MRKIKHIEGKEGMYGKFAYDILVWTKRSELEIAFKVLGKNFRKI